MSTAAIGWKYLTVPVNKHSFRTPLSEVTISTRQDWKRTLLRSLDYYYLHRAPYYERTMQFFVDTLDDQETNLSRLLIHCLRATCRHIGLRPSRWIIFSENEFSFDLRCVRDDWAVQISQSLGATSYINSIGGRKLYDKQKFTDAGVTLRFLEPNLVPYEQRGSQFMSRLSVVDALMWNEPAAVGELVGQYSIVE